VTSVGSEPVIKIADCGCGRGELARLLDIAFGTHNESDSDSGSSEESRSKINAIIHGFDVDNSVNSITMVHGACKFIPHVGDMAPDNFEETSPLDVVVYCLSLFEEDVTPTSTGPTVS